MNIAAVIPLIVFVAGIALILFFAFRKDPIFEATITALGGKLDRISGRFIFNKNGIDFWYRYTPPSRNSPAVLTIAAPCRSRGEFTVIPESKFDREAKKIGFATEIQTHDADFDNKYYIISDTVDFAREYFKTELKRQGVNKLYLAGFTKISHDGKILKAEWAGFDKKQLRPDLIRKVAEMLFEMTNCLPDYFANEKIFGIPRLRLKVIAAYAISSLGFLSGLTAYFWVTRYPPLDSFAIFLKSLLFSLPAFIAYMILTAILVRGRANAHKDFLIISMISIAACVLLANNSLIIINGKLDSNKQENHDAIIMSKYMVKDDNSKSYYIKVSSWRSGRRIEKFEVSKYEYSRIVAGQTIARITTKRGALGFEWVVRIGYNIK